MANKVSYFKVSDLPIVESVPEGATVLAYNDGLLMRVDGSKIGGGVKTIKFIGNAETMTFSCTHTYEEFQEIVTGDDAYIIQVIVPMDETTVAYLSSLAVRQFNGDFVGFEIEIAFMGQMQVLKYLNDGTIAFE